MSMYYVVKSWWHKLSNVKHILLNIRNKIFYSLYTVEIILLLGCSTLFIIRIIPHADKSIHDIFMQKLAISTQNKSISETQIFDLHKVNPTPLYGNNELVSIQMPSSQTPRSKAYAPSGIFKNTYDGHLNHKNKEEKNTTQSVLTRNHVNPYVLSSLSINDIIFRKTQNYKISFQTKTVLTPVKKSFVTEPKQYPIQTQKIIKAMMRKGMLRNIITKGRNWLQERNCLASAIYFEARSEPRQGRWAVAEVVLNRVNSKYYPATICGVVFEGQHKRFKCQFSFACDGLSDIPRDKKAWRDAIKMANLVISGKKRLKRLNGATHYHANYVQPKWASTLTLIEKIGQHIFYKNHRWG